MRRYQLTVDVEIEEDDLATLKPLECARSLSLIENGIIDAVVDTAKSTGRRMRVCRIQRDRMWVEDGR